MDAEALKAKLSLVFDTPAECFTCRYCFDISKGKNLGFDLSDFGNAKRVCQNGNYTSKIHLDRENEDGFVAIYECPEDNICEYWRPNTFNKAALAEEAYRDVGILIKRIREREAITEEEVKQIARELNLGST